MVLRLGPADKLPCTICLFVLSIPPPSWHNRPVIPAFREAPNLLSPFPKASIHVSPFPEVANSISRFYTVVHGVMKTRRPNPEPRVGVSVPKRKLPPVSGGMASDGGKLCHNGCCGCLTVLVIILLAVSWPSLESKSTASTRPRPVRQTYAVFAGPSLTNYCNKVKANGFVLADVVRFGPVFPRLRASLRCLPANVPDHRVFLAIPTTLRPSPVAGPLAVPSLPNHHPLKTNAVPVGDSPQSRTKNGVEVVSMISFQYHIEQANLFQLYQAFGDPQVCYVPRAIGSHLDTV
jgi:hypothetical protein